MWIFFAISFRGKPQGVISQHWYFKVKVTEKGPKIFDNAFAWCLYKGADNRPIKYSVSHAGKLSMATCGHASAIYIRVLIKDILHLANEIHHPSIVAFGYQVEKNPKKRFQIIRDLMWPARWIMQTCYRYKLPDALNTKSFSSPQARDK
jgi:hypothetical protein